MRASRQIELSREEVEYLLGKIPVVAGKVDPLPESRSPGRCLVKLDENDFESFSDGVVRLLAEVGFNIDYTLNQEGELLEGIMEKLRAD